MKLMLLILVDFATLAVFAVPLDDDIYDVPYQRFISYTDRNGDESIIDLEDLPDEQLLKEIRRNPSYGSVLTLFTRRNPTVGQILDNSKSIYKSNFNPKVETVILVHGWLSNEESGIDTETRDALLGRKDCNVIILDWQGLARSNYVTVVLGVSAVGQGLGNFVDYLSHITGASLQTFHLIGFSLGAHIVGNAGRQVGGRIGRITALDPAGPLWHQNSKRIKSTDAIYVEGIHTDGGLNDASLGYGLSVGDIDFFPNGGSDQPGCFTHTCGHNRAWRFFAATVTYDHLEGRKCSNRVQLVANTCRGDRLKMGNTKLNKNGSGKYRVKTGRRYPYY